MAIDKEKFGISQAELKNAALGDFDDYVPEQTPPKKFSAQQAVNNAAPVAVEQNSPKAKKAEKQKIQKEKPAKANTDSSVDESASAFLSNLYIVSFVKSLFTKSKIGVCIWLFMNMLVMVSPFIYVAISTGDAILAIPGALFGLFIYLVSLVAALSPIGEAVLRWQNKCKKIKDAGILNRIQPLFDTVYAQAKEKDPTISDKVRLFMSYDDSPNAFATGRRTVCITAGLLDLSDEDIKAILAHEFGHLSHKDTDIILAVSVGNMLITGVMAIINIFVNIAVFVIGIAASDKNGTTFKLLYKAANFFFYIIMYLWTKLGVLLCLHSNRKGEFAADAFAVDLGYRNELSHALVTIDGGGFPTSKGLWASLHSSHPETADRINEMNLHSTQKVLDNRS